MGANSRSLGACISLLLLTACASAASVAAPDIFSSPDTSYERSAKALEIQADIMRPGYSDIAMHSCSHDDDLIHYNGNTTIQLVNCILDAPESAHRLVITSAGGNVDLAIFAAYVLKARALDIEVVGNCMSSCANYLLPAAKRVYIDQHSAVLVHGGALPPDRGALIEALKRAGASESSPFFERDIETNLKGSGLTYRLHNNFQRHFDVGSGYYDLADIWSARRSAGQSNTSGMVLVDPPSLQRCLPNVEIVAETPNPEGLLRLFPNYNLGSFADVRGADSLCSF